MSDRGMKKWAPYKALIEQTEALNKTLSKKEKQEKPKISSEVAEQINEILVNYHNQEVILSYFRDGFIYKIKTIIKIDAINRKITLLSNNKVIKFNEMFNLVNAI